MVDSALVDEVPVAVASLSDSALGGCHAQRRARGELLDRINTQWPPGTTVPPLRELARDLGVAYGTLRGAVRSLVAAGYLTSKPRQGVVVRHRPAAQVQTGRPSGGGRYPAMDSLRGKTIEMAFSFEDAGFVPEMVKAFSERVLEAGATVRTRLIPILESLDLTERSAMGDFTHSPADAMVTFNVQVPVTPKRGCPTVVLTTAVDSEVRALQGYDMVMVDSTQGGRLAAQWLRDCHCQRPAFLGVARRGTDGQINWSPTSLARYRAFADGWEHEPPMLWTTSYSVRLAAQGFEQFMRLSPRPDALFAASDELAVGFLLAAQASGFPVHEHVHVIGFDGQQRARSLRFDRFATVAVATQQMGVVGAELMAARMADPHLAVRRVHVGCSMLPLGPNASLVASPTPS